MRFITTAAVVLLASIPTFSSAAPAPLEPRQQDTVTFEGAGPNPPSYSLSPPFRGENITINNPLSVSHIRVNVDRGVCSFRGINGSFVFIVGSGSVDVGPPQVQTSVKCAGFDCIGFPQYCENGGKPPGT
ncbi:hypothetical protein G7Y79_00072g097550 [Physcia stellaris]|nr:hypothetical protein G7Y79_00072g097550 [Physcia stellaris]